MKDEARLIATASQTVGPFFHFALTATPHGDMRRRFTGGEPIYLEIRVTDGDERPVNDAMVELCQAGVFGRMATGDDGTCFFETVRPGTEEPGANGSGAPHISVHLFARGLLRHLYTRIYFAGDRRLAVDPVLALVPPDRQETLFARPDGVSPGRWTFHVRLQGAHETVFFDA